ncbi:hypothetical protein AG0111_0g7058 [Alternaria gaisen]|uniref:Uncharacterized protein n=1 Tax=Alternaria gaisen TaxID=167740 RepID=A0ACB6FLK5_9PLEO|nr:hypothetical protein AG0111_0g7058 [Alternaria gaisen]
MGNPKALLESKKSATDSTVDSSRSHQHPPLWLAAKNGKEYEVKELVLSTSEWRKTMKDPDGRTALWWAVSTGQARIAGLLLATGGFDVNERPDGHHGLLHEAVRANDIAVTKVLLGRGDLDVNIKDTSGFDNPNKQTPLHLATDRGLKEMVELLLLHPDIDVNPRDENGETPLHTAARKDRMEILVLLLAHPGIDVNSRDAGGGTLLHASATQGYMEILRLLLARPDVDVNFRDVVGDTPLHKAASKGHMEILVLLLAQANIDWAPRNGYGSTPLYQAARHGHEELVDALLDTPNSEAMFDIGLDKYGRSPLHAAALNGHRGVVRLLLSHNSTDPGLQDKHGEIPLHLAATHGHQHVVSELLATSGVEDMVNLQNTRGETPLHRAANYGHEGCVIKLTDYADVNAEDEMLRTPLHSAAKGEHHKVVEHLLKKSGILIHVSDKDGYTPLHLALRMGHESIARQLLKGSGLGKTPESTYRRALLSCATQTGNASMLKLLLERSEFNVVAADINALDEDGRTLLWSAAKRQNTHVMELLLTKDKATLSLLVQRGEASLVKVLLKAGYNVDTRDNLGRSALHIATILGHFDIAKSLVSFGASVDCKDGRGNTALRLAIKRKRCDFIDMLLERSTEITGIRTHEWLDAYGQEIPAAVYLKEELIGKKTISFIEAAVVPDTIRQMHNAPKIERRLILLANELPWQNGQLHPNIVPIRPNMLETSASSPSRSGKVRFSIATCFPAGFDKVTGNHFKVPDRGTCRITWSTSSTLNADGESRYEPTDYFSMLPSGNIPKNGLDFFAQFLSYLREVWLETCDLAEKHLAECRISQLEERGSNRELILRLAQNARTWADLRKILKEQTKTAQEFASNYSFRYNGNQGSDEVDMLLSDFTTTIGGRLDGLDQTVRDLLQLEFAWVSVNDAYRSISIATSAKRLSWITFIFLPAMFTSSLFGMNVNILKDNPDWRWFLLAAGICLVSTICGWLIFKYCPIESWIERKAGKRIQRVANVPVQVASP